jgi:hypothetical protein
VIFCHIYQTMDKVQNKPHSSVHHTPSSESFKVYWREAYHSLPFSAEVKNGGVIPPLSRTSSLFWCLIN